MKFFKLKDMLKSWSVWGLGAITSVALLADNTEWVTELVPVEHQPKVFAILGFVTLLARLVKQGGK